MPEESLWAHRPPAGRSRNYSCYSDNPPRLSPANLTFTSLQGSLSPHQPSLQRRRRKLLESRHPPRADPAGLISGWGWQLLGAPGCVPVSPWPQFPPLHKEGDDSVQAGFLWGLREVWWGAACHTDTQTSPTRTITTAFFFFFFTTSKHASLAFSSFDISGKSVCVLHHSVKSDSLQTPWALA